MPLTAPPAASAPFASGGDVLEVRTPEGVSFHYELAGLPSRAVAWAVDLACIGAVLLVLGWLSALLGLVWQDLGAAVQLAVAGVSLWAWPALWEGRAGWTPGKRMLGLRVLREDGTAVGLREALLRSVLRFVDMLPAAHGVGLLSATLDARMRRLGDRLAGTVVVRVPSNRALPRLVRSVGLDPQRVERLAALEPAVARLSAAERDAAELLLARREELAMAVRRELFGQLAEHLERKLRVRRPSHLSPEGYVAAVLHAAWERAEKLRREGFR